MLPFISIKIWDKTIYWTLHSLAHVPRVGEQIELPFFKAYLKFNIFYVHSITHELYRGTQIIRITLINGYYNKFWHIRRDEAKLKRELYWRDLIDLSEDELQQQLGY